MVETLMELRKVNRIFGKGDLAVHALKDVDLKIPEAAFLTITGPSGSGKSTLLNILGMLDQPSSGNYLFKNKLIKTSDFNKLANFRSHYLGFIFQSFNLIPVLSAKENVSVPLFIRDDIEDDEKERRVNSLLEAVGLTEHGHKKPSELSGGQKQRVAVARSLICKPKVVFADEPTANLDTKTSEMILQTMRKMNEENNTAFIFSTHDPRIEKYAKQRVNLVDGEIQSESTSG